MLRETASFYGTLSRILAPPCTPDQGLGIGAFLDGSSVVTGRFQSTATFGAGEPNETIVVAAGSEDIFAARYNADGTLDWGTSAGGFGNDVGRGVVAFDDGSSAVTGSFNGTATFAAGEPNVTFLTSTGSGDIFVAHYSAAPVLFLDPVVLLERLALNVFALNLQHGIENSLDAKLDTVLDALDDVNSNDDVAAVNAR